MAIGSQVVTLKHAHMRNIKWTHVCVYVYECVYKCVFMCVCMSVCLYEYVSTAEGVIIEKE